MIIRSWLKTKYKITISIIILLSIFAHIYFPIQVHAKSNNQKATGTDVVSYAKKFVGNPYCYGGTSLTKGTDCSGFTQSVYRHFGYKIPRTSYTQRKAGIKVSSLKKAKAGDLICYYGHVAIYMGKNKIIHASNKKTGIKIYNNVCYRKIASIRRIVK